MAEKEQRQASETALRAQVIDAMTRQDAALNAERETRAAYEDLKLVAFRYSSFLWVGSALIYFPSGLLMYSFSCSFPFQLLVRRRSICSRKRKR